MTKHLKRQLRLLKPKTQHRPLAKMPKKKPLSLTDKTVALIKRNPWKVIVGVVLFFGGIPTAVTGGNAIVQFIDPVVPAFHYYVNDRLAPILLVQNTQSVAIDRFILYQQQRDLATAQADPAAKSSQIVQDRVKDLQQQIQDTQARINKAGAK